MPGGGTDPFADAEADNQQKDLIHIRVQQRNGRKCITTVQVRHLGIYLPPATSSYLHLPPPSASTRLYMPLSPCRTSTSSSTSRR